MAKKPTVLIAGHGADWIYTMVSNAIAPVGAIEYTSDPLEFMATKPPHIVGVLCVMTSERFIPTGKKFLLNLGQVGLSSEQVGVIAKGVIPWEGTMTWKIHNPENTQAIKAIAQMWLGIKNR